MLTKLILVCLLYLLPIHGFAQEDAFTLESVLQRFTKAYGGFRDADTLTSLSVEGTILQNGQTFDFLMRKKRPHFMRYRLSNDYNSVIAGYDGSQGWILTKNNQEVSIDLIDQEAHRKIRDQSRFDSPLFFHLQKSEHQIELIYLILTKAD